MTDESTISIHFYRPATMWERRIGRCPACGHRGRIVGMVQIWHDTRWTCLSCGDAWEGGFRLPRPLKPGWREKSIADAKSNWNKGSTRADVSAWIAREFDGHQGPA